MTIQEWLQLPNRRSNSKGETTKHLLFITLVACILVGCQRDLVQRNYDRHYDAYHLAHPFEPKWYETDPNDNEVPK